MPSTCLPLYTPTSSIITRTSTPRSAGLTFHHATTLRKLHGNNSITCKASSSSSSSSLSSLVDFDLYDLLGIESSSDQWQIKMAYRKLQKRCHPDIAGPAGHDMAIILNEVYSVLSDPNLRLAYDKEQAKIAGLRGYTGKPLYSVWYGSESEERAVFVDEVKCVGCLKSRVVAQWADPEYKIQQAIDACPVDCISMVERSNLAALEFLMSKQPRGSVRMSADVKKFQTRFHDAMDKASTHGSKEKDDQREARISAIQTIRSITNWLYWQAPTGGSDSGQSLTRVAGRLSGPDINKLRDAAAARKQARESTGPRSRTMPSYIYDAEYWIPSTLALPAANQNNDLASKAASSESSPPSKQWKGKSEKDHGVSKNNRRSSTIWQIPLATATIAAVVVRFQLGEGAVGELKEHIGGSLALYIVNSSWLQVVLAGVTWYLIGTYMVELLEVIRNRDKV
ncbi:hypothetical protein AAG906_007977 [Vitis piasezkii]